MSHPEHGPLTEMLVSVAMCAHFVGDFVLQSRWMGDNKSSRMAPLFAHIAVYAATLFTAFVIVVSWQDAASLAIINGWAHLCTDYGTSRLSKAAYLKARMHMFWCIIGADQLAHALVLVWSFSWIL